MDTQLVIWFDMHPIYFVADEEKAAMQEAYLSYLAHFFGGKKRNVDEAQQSAADAVNEMSKCTIRS